MMELPVASKRGPRYIYSECPKCESEKGAKIQDEIDRAVANGKHELLRIADVPTRYKKYDVKELVPINKEQGEIISRCSSYVENWDKVKKLGTSLVFTGQPGTGKTLIALGMVPGIIQKSVESMIPKAREEQFPGMHITERCQYHVVKYVNIYDLFSAIKSTYSRNSDENELQVLRHYTNPHLLILDEIGVQAGTDYETMLLFRVINKRYEEMKPTILISNLTEKDLTEYIGHRTIDRFRENHGAVFVFNWDSARK